MSLANTDLILTEAIVRNIRNYANYCKRKADIPVVKKRSYVRTSAVYETQPIKDIFDKLEETIELLRDCASRIREDKGSAQYERLRDEIKVASVITIANLHKPDRCEGREEIMGSIVEILRIMSVITESRESERFMTLYREALMVLDSLLALYSPTLYGNRQKEIQLPLVETYGSSTRWKKPNSVNKEESNKVDKKEKRNASKKKKTRRVMPSLVDQLTEE